MANEWYVRHGDKLYGPMTPANLKKLALERKITPATSVRLGAAGTWVPASRVQGLFAPPKPNAAAPTPRSAPLPKAVPVAAPLAAPPTPPPQAPPQAAPMAPPPWARPAAGVGAKIVGAVAIVLGAVAMATFWLPILHGPVGWTAIVAGALGLVVGIVGLIVAAMSGGSGLILNIAGTSSSAVGLVLAVVLGVTFGLFSGAPPQVIVQRPTLPPVQSPPPQEAPSEPETPPEPIWTDAGESIVQDGIKATIVSVGIEQIRMESADISVMKREPPKPMLKIRVALENVTADKIMEVPGWVGGGDLIGQGVGQLLGGDAGKAVQAATATATLTDNAGNVYKQTSTLSVFGAKINFGEDHALRPGQSTQAELIFPPPLATAEFLRLELSPAGFSGSEALRFQIPKTMIGASPGTGN